MELLGEMESRIKEADREQDGWFRAMYESKVRHLVYLVEQLPGGRGRRG